MSIISKKKKTYPIGKYLRSYLRKNNREENNIHLDYSDLRRFEYARPLLDRHGNDTLWESVQYAPNDRKEIFPELTHIYALLRTEGDTSVMKHLQVARVDYCTFGNSNPFRVRIVNQYNDNYDYFYVKTADASRIYGLELEHVLSPNRIAYLVQNNTLIEEHIAGIPGDMFISNYLNHPETNQVRLAKEFVKFNERCLVRLLGDMRAYNFVIDITPDFDDVQYRIRSIDFDQQSYEGQKEVYMPRFFKENRPFAELCEKHLNEATILQYQREEQSMIAVRCRKSQVRLQELEMCALEIDLSEPDKVQQLKKELAGFYQNDSFLQCSSMGSIVKASLRNILDIHHKQVLPH
ncbi:MAG: hypothetical protein IPL35_17260 [Sphingobacteriales bacterium]|nr:hypothetical protein [Sphingobacteriales bacterium]